MASLTMSSDDNRRPWELQEMIRQAVRRAVRHAVRTNLSAMSIVATSSCKGTVAAFATGQGHCIRMWLQSESHISAHRTYFPSFFDCFLSFQLPAFDSHQRLKVPPVPKLHRNLSCIPSKQMQTSGFWYSCHRSNCRLIIHKSCCSGTWTRSCIDTTNRQHGQCGRVPTGWPSCTIQV